MIFQENSAVSYDLVTLCVHFLDNTKEKIIFPKFHYMSQMALRAIISFIQVIIILHNIDRDQIKFLKKLL